MNTAIDVRGETTPPRHRAVLTCDECVSPTGMLAGDAQKASSQGAQWETTDAAKGVGTHGETRTRGRQGNRGRLRVRHLIDMVCWSRRPPKPLRSVRLELTATEERNCEHSNRCERRNHASEASSGPHVRRVCLTDGDARRRCPKSLFAGGPMGDDGRSKRGGYSR